MLVQLRGMKIYKTESNGRPPPTYTQRNIICFPREYYQHLCELFASIYILHSIVPSLCLNSLNRYKHSSTCPPWMFFVSLINFPGLTPKSLNSVESRSRCTLGGCSKQNQTMNEWSLNIAPKIQITRTMYNSEKIISLGKVGTS